MGTWGVFSSASKTGELPYNLYNVGMTWKARKTNKLSALYNKIKKDQFCFAQMWIFLHGKRKMLQWAIKTVHCTVHKILGIKYNKFHITWDFKS
jgi:hypothetical protein